MSERLHNDHMKTVTPQYSFKHDRFIDLIVEKSMRDHTHYHSLDRYKDDVFITYQLEEKYPYDDTWIMEVFITSKFMQACGFKFEDIFTHPLVLYRTFVLWHLVSEFLRSPEKVAVYNDGFREIEISIKVPGFVSIISKSCFEINIPIAKWVTELGNNPYPPEFSGALDFLLADGYKCQDEMLARCGNLDEFIFHVYTRMSTDSNPS